MRDHAACLNCGSAFPENARVDRKYCSRRCNSNHYKRVRRGTAAPLPQTDYAALMAQIPPDRLAWVAGIIEGEGSISVHQKQWGGNVYTHSLIQVGMVDEDVIRRLREWTGVGRVSGPHLPPVRAKAGHQPQWHWNVNNMQAVEALISAIWPLLSQRRRQQATKVRQRMAERTLKRGR